MFTSKQKLLMGGAVLFAVLPVADGYYGSRWLHGPDVQSVTEYVFPDEPLPEQMNRPVRASVAQYTPSVIEADLESEEEEVHETAREFVQTEPFGAKTNSLDEESQTVRVF